MVATTTRSFIHVEDVCAGLRMLMARGEVGRVYNIGTGPELSMHQLANEVKRVLKSSSEVVEVERPRDVLGCRRRVPDSAKLRTLGWEPKKSLADAIQDLAEHLRGNA